MRTIRRWIAWFESSLPKRVFTRFGKRRGNVLAGGIAYYAVFSLFPALAAGLTVLGLVLRDSEELQRRIADYVNDLFGTTIIGVEPIPPNPSGLVSMSTLTAGTTLSITGVVSLLLLIWAGLGCLSALGRGIQAMFDVVPDQNIVLSKTFDLLALLVLGSAIIASIAGGVVVTSASSWLSDILGLGRSSLATVGTGLVAALVTLLIDSGIILALMRIQARIALPLRELWPAALVGGIGLGLLKFLARFVFAQASGNEFLATFAGVIGLLLWFNFSARIALLSGALAAEIVSGRGLLVLEDQVDMTAIRPPRHSAATREAAVLAERAAQRAERPDGATPRFGPRSSDRVTVAAGVVLGATAAASWRTLTGLRRLSARADRSRSRSSGRTTA